MPQADNAERFGRYYRDNYIKVYRLALGLANRGSSVAERNKDAEDITQEAFLRAYHSFPAFREESSFLTWICRITMNVANDYMRQRTRLRIYETLDQLGCSEEDLKSPVDPDDPETRLLSNEVMRVCMYGFTESLPLRQKKVFFLVVGMDLPYKIAAEIMECSVGALKVMLHRAKVRLASYMESRCSLIRKSNSCRCEEWVGACLSHGRITTECITHPTAAITVPDRVTIYMRDLRDIYGKVYHARTDEQMAEMLKDGFEKKRWATFT